MAHKLHTSQAAIPYYHDAAAMFARLGGTSRDDTVLLESADITSKASTNSLAIIQACLRVTCSVQTVEVIALTAVGEVLLADLVAQFAHNPAVTVSQHALSEGGLSGARFMIHPPHHIDERQRLLALSNIEIVRALYQRAPYSGSRLPLLGGGFAFDYVASFEQLPQVAAGPNSYPDYQFVVAQQLLAVDHLTQQATVEVLGFDAADTAAQLAEIAAALQGEWWQLAAATATAAESAAPGAAEGVAPAAAVQNATVLQSPGVITATALTSDAVFCDQVRQMQEQIRIGNAYQVVPARGFEIACPDAFAAYLELKRSNPSPYMFYLRSHSISDTGAIDTDATSGDTATTAAAAAATGFELFGASPESNLKFDPTDRNVQLYPIAGTRPRGLNPDGSINHELDIRAELAMRTDAKELAEHTMLVDLARNDLARVAVPKTRKVADLLQVDRYSRVMHLVSRVTATLHPDFDALDAYRACMNMGTLTGAPKLKAMELIRELEGTRRGSYGGAVGYIRGDGTFDTAIVIRSALVQRGSAIVQAGAGVVRDSAPQAEADETVHKAYAVLHAIAASQAKTLEIIR